MLSRRGSRYVVAYRSVKVFVLLIDNLLVFVIVHLNYILLKINDWLFSNDQIDNTTITLLNTYHSFHNTYYYTTLLYNYETNLSVHDKQIIT